MDNEMLAFTKYNEFGIVWVMSFKQNVDQQTLYLCIIWNQINVKLFCISNKSDLSLNPFLSAYSARLNFEHWSRIVKVSRKSDMTWYLFDMTMILHKLPCSLSWENLLEII